MTLLVEVLTLLLAIILLYILWKILEEVSRLIVNSIMGIIIFWALNNFFNFGIVINWLSILIVALAGIPGVLIVLIVHFLGWGF